MVTLSFTIFSGQKNYNRAHMLFQVLCGFEPIFYTTHPNEESIFFIAMLPLAELRIAIPTGLTMNVPIIQTYIISLIGNILPLPFVFYFSQKILSWGKDKKYIGSF